MSVLIRPCAGRLLLGAILAVVWSSASAQTPAVTVSFGDTAYAVNEGGSVAVQVQLSADPQRSLTILLDATPDNGAGTGDFTVPAQVIFNSGQTLNSVTFTATEDTEDDDDETVELGFGTLPPNVSEGSPGTATVTIADDDDPAVTVSFESATTTVTEGWTVDVVVTLDVDPERTVTIPVQASPAASGDYAISGSVRFEAGETQKPANFATVDDTAVEDEETFTVSFGSPLPTGVSLGSSQTTTEVTVTDDDAPDLGGLELSALTVTGGVGSMYPVFNPRTYHYAIRCRDATTLRVQATARDTSHQLTLNNIPVPGTALDNNVIVDSDQDVAIELSDGGTAVTYVVHCIPATFPNITIVKKQAGVSDGLLFVTLAQQTFPNPPAFMAILDNNGVPRFVKDSFPVRETPMNFRRHATNPVVDGRHVHYSVTHRLGASFNGRHLLLDESFNTIKTVETALADRFTNLHDFLITEEGNFLFLSRGTVTRTVGGKEVETLQNMIEEVSPTGEAVWSWSSWDHLTIDPDCLGYTYGVSTEPDITAHINALTLIDGDVVASSRGCAQIVRINRSAKSETDDGTDLVWQLGGTDQDSMFPDSRAFLAISGDENGRNEFCRQHHATETAAGTVVLFDNGVNCLSAELDDESAEPKRGDLPTFSRVVEYDIDTTTGTAEFLREFRLDRRYGYAPFTGSVDVLANGHWLFTWGYLLYADSSLSVAERAIAISEMDASGTELLRVNAWAGSYPYFTFRAYREAEADVAIPLNLPVVLTLEDEQAAESDGEMVFEVEPSVASSEEVTVDYTTANGTATAGQDYTAQSDTLTFPANSTIPQEIRVPILDDDRDEAEEETFTVRLRNATNARLAGGGTTLTATGTITDDDEPVVAVSFGAARYTVPEDTTVEIRVRLSVDPERRVEIPLTATPGDNVTASDYEGVPPTVVFESGERVQTFFFSALADQEEEATETVTLSVDEPLPTRVERGSPATTVVRIGRLPPPPPPPSGGGGSGGGSQDLHGNTPAQATHVRPGSSAPWVSSTTGQINPADDIDYFQFRLPQAGVLVVETTGSTDTVGTVWQDGRELASATRRGARQNFHLSVPVKAGEVVIAVAGERGRTGSYVLQAALVVGYLENPGPASFQSGVGVLSGWVCEAEGVVLEITQADGTVVTEAAAYGTERADTATLPSGEAVCGDTDNGFGLLVNWNRLGDGAHEVVALVDGVPIGRRSTVDGIELGRATVTVTTLGEEFVRGVAGECTVEDFPGPGESVTLEWQQSQQNFVLAGAAPPTGESRAGEPGVGYLENPAPYSFQSGVGVLSGWVCAAEAVVIEMTQADGTVLTQAAAYGTERLDTADLCGDTDNGFGLLFNWNRLGAGAHEVVALVDGEELGRATVTVTTLGEEFLRGVEGECVVDDFPTEGQTVTLTWQQGQQNFVITDVE